MYKNFPDTHYHLDGSKYFLDNLSKIVKSDHVNIRELDINLEAFCFFIKNVGDTYTFEARKNIKKQNIRGQMLKKLSNLIEKWKKETNKDEAIDFFYRKRHQAKKKRLRPLTNIPIYQEKGIKVYAPDITLLVSPTTGLPIEILEVGIIDDLRFKDWVGKENVIELCDRVYSRIEIITINAILEFNIAINS